MLHWLFGCHRCHKGGQARSGFENEMVKEESCQRRESEESGFGDEEHSEASLNVKEEGGTSQRQGSDEPLWPNEDDSDMCEAEAESSIPVSHLQALFDESFSLDTGVGAEEGDSTFKDASRNMDLVPIWMDGEGLQWSPSPNIPPGRYTPVLFWKRDVGPVVQPMHWGIERLETYFNARECRGSGDQPAIWSTFEGGEKVYHHLRRFLCVEEGGQTAFLSL